MSYESGNVNFGASATLRKWPSLGGQRIAHLVEFGPYTVLDARLDECVFALMSKPESQRHLYEIHTGQQEPLVTATITAARAAELARLCRCPSGSKLPSSRSMEKTPPLMIFGR